MPFHLAFTLRDLGERPNAARCDIVDPGARLGYGEENSVPGLLFEHRLGLGLMQNSFDGSERRRAPRALELAKTLRDEGFWVIVTGPDGKTVDETEDE